jgi:hypothetical protein
MRALAALLWIAVELGVEKLQVHGDSKLITDWESKSIPFQKIGLQAVWIRFSIGADS